VRFAICNEMFEGWEWGRTCRFAAEVGYQGIEVAPFTLAQSVNDISAESRLRIRREAEQAGLAIVGLHWLLVSPKGMYLNHPDAAIRQQTADYLCSLVDFGADLGGTLMVFGSPKQRSVHPDLDPSIARRFAKEALARPLDRAAQRGIIICFEPLSPEETDFINTAAEARALIEEVAHPNLRLILDVKAMSSEGRPIPEIIRENREHVAHVHANDANRRGPGFGDTDFGPIAKTLADIGYKGWVSVEVFEYSPDPETIARQSLAYLQQKFA